jgi:hypothetical protein
MSHLVAATSESAVKEMFEGFRNRFTFADTNSGSFGPFTASYDIQLHLEDGSVELNDDNTISIAELDIKWDRLQLCIGVDIPGFCIGGFCIIPIPFDGCLLRAPELCLFQDNPDLQFCLDLSGVITSEVSAKVRPLVRYRVDPNRTPAINDLDAQDAGVPNRWQLFLDPVTVDIADTVGDLIERAIDNFIDVVLGPLPDWAKDLVRAILGPLDDFIRGLLDIGDDIDEWLTNLLGVSLGLIDTIINAVADFFANQQPLFSFEDPLQILGPEPPPPLPPLLNPVKIPIRDVTVAINSAELVVEANVGPSHGRTGQPPTARTDHLGQRGPVGNGGGRPPVPPARPLLRHRPPRGPTRWRGRARRPRANWPAGRRGPSPERPRRPELDPPQPAAAPARRPGTRLNGGQGGLCAVQQHRAGGRLCGDGHHARGARAALRHPRAR